MSIYTSILVGSISCEIEKYKKIYLVLCPILNHQQTVS